MSDMHVLTSTDDGHTRVVMHFPTPSGNNSFGVAWSNAWIDSGSGGPTVLLEGIGNNGTIIAAEKVQVANGGVIEVVGNFPIESNGDSPQNIQSALRYFYVREKLSVTSLLQRKLKWFGLTEDEA